MTPAELIALRARLGLSQAALARALGMSRSQIMDYERGHDRSAEARPVAIPRVVELACAAIETANRDIS